VKGVPSAQRASGRSVIVTSVKPSL